MQSRESESIGERLLRERRGRERRRAIRRSIGGLVVWVRRGLPGRPDGLDPYGSGGRNYDRIHASDGRERRLRAGGRIRGWITVGRR